MKILICFKEVVDSTLDLGFGRVSPALFRKALTCRLDPADLDCLHLALAAKGAGGKTEIELVSIGQERVEAYLREGLAAGADKAIRLWDASFEELSTAQKALVVARAATISGADLVLCGSASLDSGSGVFGGLLAARLGWPFATDVQDFRKEEKTASLNVMRVLPRGRRENLELSLPAVLALKAAARTVPDATLARLLESREASLDLLSLAELGLSKSELNDQPASQGQWSFPSPALKPAPLDSSLPAFYRILKLLEGGISQRRGEILKGDKLALANQLFQILLEGEILKTPAGK
jgi:electron transfer flavoprotein beta subunit